MRQAKMARRHADWPSDEDEDNRHDLHPHGHSYHFASEIFPLLKKFLDYNAVRYAYRGQQIGSEDEVRRWLCTNGLPEHGNTLTKHEEKTIKHWASFAFVKLSDLKAAGETSQDEIVGILHKLGLQQADNGRFQFVRGRGDTFDNLAEIQTRLHTEGGAIFPRAAYVNKVTEQEQVKLRVWAARAMTATEKGPSTPPKAKQTSTSRKATTAKKNGKSADKRKVESDRKKPPTVSPTQSTPSAKAEAKTSGSVSSLSEQHDENEKAQPHLFEQLDHQHFRQQIAPLLKKAFTSTRNEYAYGDQKIGTDGDLRLWICRNGVPSEHLTDEEAKRVYIWASYALVKLSDLDHSETAYSDNQIEHVLSKCSIRRERHGKYSLQGKNLGNERDVAQLLCTEVIHRSVYKKLSEEEKANLRLWAARQNCLDVRKFGVQEDSMRKRSLYYTLLGLMLLLAVFGAVFVVRPAIGWHFVTTRVGKSVPNVCLLFQVKC